MNWNISANDMIPKTDLDSSRTTEQCFRQDKTRENTSRKLSSKLQVGMSWCACTGGGMH